MLRLETASARARIVTAGGEFGRDRERAHRIRDYSLVSAPRQPAFNRLQEFFGDVAHRRVNDAVRDREVLPLEMGLRPQVCKNQR